MEALSVWRILLSNPRHAVTSSAMIGAYLFWDRSAPGQTRASGFAGALRCGDRAPHPHLFHGAILCDGTREKVALPVLQDGRALLFTGFVANRRELRHALDMQGVDDAALYAAARDRWGAGADTRVIGEYAAILVPPGAGPAELVRSPVMAPPLHVWRDRDRLIVASHPQAIFATGEVARRLDDQKLADSLLLNYGEERRGWFEGVQRVARGVQARAHRGGLDEHCFWRMEDIAPIRLRHDHEYVEALDALFHEATADMLDGFSTPAVSLSGGFDSQTVAVYAMAHSPDAPLLAGTSVPAPGWVAPDPDAMVDESPHVRALAEMYPQLRPHWITSEGRDIGYHQRDMFEAAMAPPRNGANLHWIHDLRKTMRAAGADVLLTGAMGNLTFSYNGTGVIPDLLRQGRIGAFAREIWHGGPGGKLGHRALREGMIPLMPAAMRRAFYRWRGGEGPAPLDSWSPIHPDFAEGHDVFARAEAMGMDVTFQPLTSTRAWRHALLSRAINEGGDIGAGMDRVHGLPSRDPTRHRRLLEFCFAIPDTQYLDRGRKRWLARRLMRGRLPAMVLQERRRGRQAADWFSRVAPARTALIDEIDWLMTDPDVSGKLDLGRLRQALVEMPDEETALGRTQMITLRLALSRGLTTARFIRFINGRNDF